jgi:excisionase family DNA binding protein
MALVSTRGPGERHVPKLLLTPEEGARALGVGRTTFYELLRTGAVASVRIGSSRRVPTSAVEDYVRRLTTPGPAPSNTDACRFPSPISARHTDERSRRGRRETANRMRHRVSHTDPGSPTVEVVPLPFATGEIE